MSLLLVRHGQSTWNAEDRWQGRADPPLSALGHEQAARAAAALPSVPGVEQLTAVAASDLRRAMQTAAHLASTLGLPPPVGVSGLRERAAGPWEGLTHAEIADRWPGSPQGPFRPPGWEDDDVLSGRAREALRALDGHLVVAHEGLIRALEGPRAPPLPNLGARWLDADLRAVGPRLALA